MPESRIRGQTIVRGDSGITKLSKIAFQGLMVVVGDQE